MSEILIRPQSRRRLTEIDHTSTVEIDEGLAREAIRNLYPCAVASDNMERVYCGGLHEEVDGVVYPAIGLDIVHDRSTDQWFAVVGGVLAGPAMFERWQFQVLTRPMLRVVRAA